MIGYHTNWLVQYLAKDEQLAEITESIKLIREYVNKEYYASKNARIAEWEPEDIDIFEMVIHIFVECLKKNSMTYQSLIGLTNGNVGCVHPLDRAKCTAEVIAIVASTGLITITKMLSNYMISTEFMLDDVIPDIDRHAPLTSKPAIKTENQILGCGYKQHDKDTCLDHINRMNGTALSLDIGLLKAMKEKATHELDTVDKQTQWKSFASKSLHTYVNLAKGDNMFYMDHAYDTRGRCYCEGYYINYQGSQYKKAIIQLHTKEIVKL